jgi:hypothetical protein
MHLNLPTGEGHYCETHGAQEMYRAMRAEYERIRREDLETRQQLLPELRKLNELLARILEKLDRDST